MEDKALEGELKFGAWCRSNGETVENGSLRTFAGMSLHRDSRGRVLPILPRAEPDAPRAEPRFRVGGDLDRDGTHRKTCMF